MMNFTNFSHLISAWMGVINMKDKIRSFLNRGAIAECKVISVEKGVKDAETRVRYPRGSGQDVVSFYIPNDKAKFIGEQVEVGMRFRGIVGFEERERGNPRW